MKYIINTESEKNNLIVVTPDLIMIGSCNKDQYEDVESKLSKGVPLDEIISKQHLKLLPQSSIQKLASRSTDDDIEIEYLADNKEEDITLEFQDPEQKQLCLTVLNQYFPSHLSQQENQQGIWASIIPSLLSLVLAVLAIFLFYTKLPKTTYIIGAFWVFVSLSSLYKRFTKPPVITRWSVDKGSLSKGFEVMKQVYTGAIVLAIIVGLAKALPQEAGPAVIYDHAVKETLYEGNIAELLEKDADINYKDSNGKTALHHLVDQADYRAYEIGENLVAAVFFKATSGKNMLNKKKLQNRPERTALAMINAGADVNVKDNSGKSLLQYAIERYSEDALTLTLFEAMLENGARLDFVMTEDRISPIEYAKAYTEEKIIDKRHLADLLAKYE
jgi:hypothetical protein